MKRAFRLLIVPGVAMGSAGAASAQNYRAVELPGLPGSFLTQPAAINESGAVTGASNTTGELGYVHGVKWIDGALIHITGTGFGGSSAAGINDAGVIVGLSDELGGNAYYQSDPGGPVMLEPIVASAAATDINNNGVIVGNAAVTKAGNVTRAARWVNGLPEDLGSLAGTNSAASAVNDAGVICGSSDIPHTSRGDDDEEPDYSVAVIFINGAIQIVADFGGYTSAAYDINNNGEVVGASKYPFLPPPALNQSLAFYWNGGEAIDLGTLNGGFSVALAINDDGVIVGYSDGRAVRVINGEMQDLNKYVVAADSNCILHSARDINNAGQIVASSTCGTARAFRLDPVAIGDVNIDGFVGVADLFQLLARWGQCSGGDLCPEDVTRDGVVNVADMFALLSNWSA
jgi:probable HAF family extracellular repeat protein